MNLCPAFEGAPLTIKSNGRVMVIAGHYVIISGLHTLVFEYLQFVALQGKDRGQVGNRGDVGFELFQIRSLRGDLVLLKE